MSSKNRQSRTLIIGSNSYLGINLCKCVSPESTILSSANINDSLNCNFEFIQSKIGGHSVSFGNNIYSRVYLLSRPVTENKQELSDFYNSIKTIVGELLKKNENLELHFASTSLIFDSITPEKKNIKSPMDLRASYELFKREFEQYLMELSSTFINASFNIHRIPLLMGGEVREKDKENQLFYKWYRMFKEQKGWIFRGEEDKKYGTSWLFTPDFCQWITGNIFLQGINTWLPKSGDITYFEFFHISQQRLFYRPLIDELKFPQSYLFLEANTPLPGRNFSDLFNP
jgi:hypothetical protein